MDDKTWWWEISIDTTKAGLERFARALITTGTGCGRAQLLFSAQLGRGVSAFLMVEVPEGREDAFRQLCKPIEMVPPPQVAVGHDRPAPDGHPGRKPPT